MNRAARKMGETYAHARATRATRTSTLMRSRFLMAAPYSANATASMAAHTMSALRTQATVKDQS